MLITREKFNEEIDTMFQYRIDFDTKNDAAVAAQLAANDAKDAAQVASDKFEAQFDYTQRLFKSFKDNTDPGTDPSP